MDETTETQTSVEAPEAAAPAAPPPADTPKAEDTKPAPGAPEKYEAFKVGDAALDADAQAEIEVLARDLNLTQEAAQKLAEARAADKAGTEAKAQEAIKAARDSWVSEIRADKELGGDKLAENLGVAKSALKQFDPDGKLGGLLESSGFGDHPEVIRFFHRIGKAMADDTFVTGSATAGTKTVAQRMFPGMNP